MISKYYRFDSNTLDLDMDDRSYTDKYYRRYKQSMFPNIKDYKNL